MKIYIAAKYGKRLTDRVRSLRGTLESRGHEVTSRWLDNGEQKAGSSRAAAEMDLLDVLRADATLFLGEPKGSENRGGGRWFELGFAYANGKLCYVVLDGGEHESVFTALEGVRTFDSDREFLDHLLRTER